VFELLYVLFDECNVSRGLVEHLFPEFGEADQAVVAEYGVAMVWPLLPICEDHGPVEPETFFGQAVLCHSCEDGEDGARDVDGCGHLYVVEGWICGICVRVCCLL
jgi:hypothetical protein